MNWGGRPMCWLTDRSSRYHTAALLALLLTGTFLFWSASRGAESARLLTLEEQQSIVCGANAQNPGRCNFPAVGSQCRKADVECDSQDDYCQTIKQALACEKAKSYENPLRCLAGGTTSLRCDEVKNRRTSAACYYWFNCTCVFDNEINIWTCEHGEGDAVGEVDVGK